MLRQLLLGVLLLACGCRGEEGGGRHFKLGVIPGAQDFVVFVMESEGLFDEYRLDPETVELLSPANLHLMIAERQIDIGFGGFTTMAIARAQGKDVIVTHGVFSPVNLVFVRKDSPLETLSDLRGGKLGLFGGPSSTTFTFLGVLARRWHDLDLLSDVELVSAPGPALANLLDRGEVDAALMGTAESIRFLAEGKYRVLVDLSAEYQARRGRTPAHVTVATTETFAAARPELLRDFLKAYRAAIALVRKRPDVWRQYGRTIGVTAETELAVLREKMTPSLVEGWDEEQIEVQQEFLSFVHEILGEKVLPGVPADLIRDDFVSRLEP